MVIVASCPSDEDLGIPLFDPGACFKNREFADTLWECAWPVGMTVNITGDRAWDPGDTWVVYSRGGRQAIRSTRTGVLRGPIPGHRGKLVILKEV